MASNFCISGSLISMDVAFLVDEADLVESEFMENVFFVVPKAKKSTWINSYTSFADMVVPDSSIEVASDENHCLYSVVVMKASVSKFINNAVQRGFVHKHVDRDREPPKDKKQNRDNLLSEKAAELSNLLRLFKTNYGEVFSIWTHLNILRVFNECVLRYGLPPNYTMFLMKTKKSKAKLKETLIECLRLLKLAGVNQLELLASSKEASHSQHIPDGDGEDTHVEAEMWRALKSSNIDEFGCPGSLTESSFEPYVCLDICWETF